MTFGKIGARKMIHHGPVLPIGARWVEYLESTGTQWIDTGVTISSGSTNISIMFDFIPTYALRDPAENGILGVSNFGSRYFGVNWTSLQNRGLQILYGSKMVNTELSSGIRYKVVMSPTVTSVNGEAILATYDSYFNRSPLNIYIFAMNALDSSNVHHINPQSATAYGFDAFDNDTLVRRLRPIAIGNKGYMLDLLTGKYEQYGNKGTGDFVIGPTIAYPERERERKRERESKQLSGLIFHFNNYSTNNIFESDFALSYLKEAA